MTNYPSMIVPANHVEPCPRRVRGVLAGMTVFDTTAAWYVWEVQSYPQYYIPVADLARGVLRSEGGLHPSRRGPVESQALWVGDVHRTGADP